MPRQTSGEKCLQDQPPQAEGDGLLQAMRTLAASKLLLVEHGLLPALDNAGESGKLAYVILG